MHNEVELEQEANKHLTKDNLARIKWACRRGMKELDLALMPFFDFEFVHLSEEEKDDFIRLLGHPDPDLFNWLMNKGQPSDARLVQMIRTIQLKNSARGAIAY
ncbi:FAD assembly factor SdhE [Thorsellia kenyensis]|uniref:FAD assembly factor SdhE n=1 Tax=Thorsellia kenyensis TaxID=1549888 RepID=A0ABV6CC31_9GAMM